jgi:hypothetical protein
MPKPMLRSMAQKMPVGYTITLPIDWQVGFLGFLKLQSPKEGFAPLSRDAATSPRSTRRFITAADSLEVTMRPSKSPIVSNVYHGTNYILSCNTLERNGLTNRSGFRDLSRYSAAIMLTAATVNILG